jgi:hypothetical protein
MAPCVNVGSHLARCILKTLTQSLLKMPGKRETIIFLSAVKIKPPQIMQRLILQYNGIALLSIVTY